MNKKLQKLLLLIFYIFCNTFHGFSQNQKKIDRLNFKLKQAKTNLEFAKIYNNLGYEYSDFNSELAKSFIYKSLKVSKKNNFKNEECYSYNNLGICQRFDNQLDSAKFYFEKGVKLGEATKNDRFLVTGYVGLGWYYQAIGELPNAMDFYKKSLEKAKLVSNIPSEADANRKIASIQISLKAYKQAFEKYRNAGKLYLSVKDSSSYGETLGSLGFAHRQIGQNDSAIFYLKKCILVFRKVKNYSMIPVAFTEIGKSYLDQKDYLNAENYLNLALVEHKKSTNTSHDDGLFIYLGQAEIGLNKFDEAKISLEKGLKFANESGDLEMQAEASNGLYKFYEKKQDYKNAYFEKGKYSSLIDSINSLANLKQVNELSSKYDYEKQQRIIEIENRKVKEKDYLVIGLVLLISLLTLLAFSYFKRLKIKEKSKLQTEIFNQQTLATQAVLDGEERERKRIAADLHDGVGQTIMALKMNLLGIHNHIKFENPKVKEIFEKAVDLASETAKEVRAISHQMMPNALIKSGLASAIREFLSNLETPNLKINLTVNNLNDPIEPTIEKVMYRIIQESVNNVIKHSKASELNIEINKKNDSIEAQISDNGIGFEKKLQFDNEGIGLKNIYDRVAFLKGKVNINSEKNKGTSIEIIIPDLPRS